MDAKTKKVIRDNVGGGADKVSFKKDGAIVFKRSYFYRHGYSAEKFGAAIEERLTVQGFKIASLETRDAWAAWPRDSYFIATVRLEGSRL
jgi:hypothetical protein